MERLIDQMPERLISREIELANTGFVGAGPIASAPPAANYPAGAMWWDNITNTAWAAVNGVWGFSDYPDVGEQVILVDEDGTILIDSDYAVLVEA